jgi:hypothetical protein
VVYRRKSQTLETVREESGISCAAIPVDTLATVARALVHRNQKRLQANGGRFQHVFQFSMCCILFRGYQIWIMNKLFQQIFCALKCAYIFWAPLYNSDSLEQRSCSDDCLLIPVNYLPIASSSSSPVEESLHFTLTGEEISEKQHSGRKT